MPNILNENGLQTKTQTELTAELVAKLKTIYGNDINVASDSPDGQMIGIYVLSSVDLLELITNVFNSFDPDKATGRVLDMRVAINGIQRKGGTYTVIPATVVTSQAVNLYGLDQDVEDVFTISDDQGTEFQLSQTMSIPTAGSYDLVFQAAEPGKVEVVPNTVVNPVTVVLGVVSVNNPTVAVSIGLDEETDPELRVRRQKSTSISAQGYRDALEAALYNVNGITSAKVYENKTGLDPDANGLPSHSIWVVVAGVYNDADVANAIYRKRGTGADMKGDNTYPILQRDGSTFIVQWDDVEFENIFVKLVVEPIDPTKLVNIALIKERLPFLFTSEIGGTENVNEIAALVQAIDPNALVTTAGLSLSAAGPFVAKLSNSAKNKQFILASPNVIITPLQIIPQNASVVGGATPETRTFVAQGGFGTYTWTVDVDNSGVGGTPASIDPSGLYTPGTGTQGTTDTLKVVDSQGNIAYVTVEVT